MLGAFISIFPNRLKALQGWKQNTISLVVFADYEIHLVKLIKTDQAIDY